MTEAWDVVVAGLGPTGCVLALLCARAGLQVLAVEPSEEPYPHPRAVAVDDDVLRILAGLIDVETNGWQRAGFHRADGRLLLDVGFGESEVGQPALAFLHQPTFERSLRAALEPAGVTVRLGDRVTFGSQDATTVTLGDGTLTRWLVACDGANSALRSELGVRWRGRDSGSTWLVVDTEVASPLPGQPYFGYLCDPVRPGVTMPFPGGHRWEWLLAPGEQLDPESLLPAGVRVIRSATYRFSARHASRWRVGRVLLAGDAAHTMPPFAGQGMGAGIRDAAQLAWRLAELCSGTTREADPLGAWESERRSHVCRVVLLSRFLGVLVTTRHAGFRDALLSGAASTPGLGGWLRSGGPRPPSGPRLPAPRLRALDGTVARLDDVIPLQWQGFRLDGTPGEPGDLVVLEPGGRRGCEDPAAVEDLDGTLLKLLARRGGRVLARPDRLLA